MELLKILIPTDCFHRIPKDEQVLFVLLGHLANELNVLGKLMGWCHNAPRTSRPEDDARVMQTMFLAKLLAGKLNEGWEAFRGGFFGTALSKEYHPLLEELHRSELEQLKHYFNRSDNAVRRVRNLTFHDSVDQIASCVEQSLTFRDELMIFLGREYANSFYAACEPVNNFAMLQAIAADDPERAIRIFLDELRDTTRLFLSIISGCMWVFISRHLGKDPDALKAETISVDAPTDGRGFAIPYFVSADAGLARSAGWIELAISSARGIEMSSWRKLETGIFVPDAVAGEWERVARPRYVAHVDMLGMSGLTVRNPRLAWAAVSKMTEAKKKVLGYSLTVDGRHDLIAEHVAAFTFSDTILLFTKGNASDDLRALLIVCLELFAQVLAGSIPVRMGIAHGLFVFNGDEGLFVGPPLVEAHRLGEEAQWIGAVVDDTVAKQTSELRPEFLSDRLPLIVEWQVPVKGPCKGLPGLLRLLPCEVAMTTVSKATRQVLSWPRSHRRNFHDVRHPITVHDFYRAFEQLFGGFSTLPQRDKAKYENTVEFVNAMLASG